MTSSLATAPPKHQQIYDVLRLEIANGGYRPGDKMPSEAELVRRFGASRITVGRAMRELQQRELVERRAGSGSYVKLQTENGLAFGLLIPDLGRSEIFEPICQGMADAPQASSHVLLWGQGSLAKIEDSSSSSSEADFKQRHIQAWALCQKYIDRNVAGVFFAPLELTEASDNINERIIAALHKARIPVVLIDRDYTPYPERSQHDLVGIDNRRTGHRATSYLIKLGAKRIAFVSYEKPAPTVAERGAGYREALYAAGLPVETKMIRQLCMSDSAGIQRALLEMNADAIVCANDPTAGHVMHGLMALGKRVPQDVRIVGIDDVRYASLLPVPLTTMRQPCREIGMAAMTAMLERIRRPDMPVRDILLECPLVVRNSCGGSVL